MTNFYHVSPSLESYWRSIILFGKNTASLKFALAKTLLEFAEKEKTIVTLEELSKPYSKHILAHLSNVDKQGTSVTSQFFDIHRKFLKGETTEDELIEFTAKQGFNIVLKAFHNVNRAEMPVKFFTFEPFNTKYKGSITLTDELLKLKESMQFENLPIETEARWRLVEAAWSLNISSRLLEIKHDSKESQLYILPKDSPRVDVTSARDALNGYQKGKCFYCFTDISIFSGSETLADVDHFIPIVTVTLTQQNLDSNCLNGIWNLVLSCKSCNRGSDGKFAKLPELKYLERLFKRNNYLIDSHHPLRETLIRQTGTSEQERVNYLQKQYSIASINLIHKWHPKEEGFEAF